jgi:hypothetical protein
MELDFALAARLGGMELSGDGPRLGCAPEGERIDPRGASERGVLWMTDSSSSRFFPEGPASIASGS